MIVIVGSPIAVRRGQDPVVSAGGLPVAISLAAVMAGATVQLVGKAGEDPVGDQTLLAVAAGGVAHVALLRDAANATPVLDAADDLDDAASVAAIAAAAVMDTADATPPDPQPAGLPVDAADVELALRYLADFRAIVVADPQPPDVLAVLGDAATWSGAELVVLVRSGDEATESAPLPASAVVIEMPAIDPEGAFARFVGELAAAIDLGATASDAFEQLEGRLARLPSG